MSRILTYKDIILNLNYCLFSSLTKTIIYRDDCVIGLNPMNSEHQQSNLCFRIRFQKKEEIEKLITESKLIFENACVVPRYFIDELCNIRLEEIELELNRIGYKVEIDTDLIMSWRLDKNQKKEDIKLNNEISLNKATMNELSELVNVFAEGYEYKDNIDWLKTKIKSQLEDGVTFHIYYVKLNNTNEIISSVILHTPIGLSQFGHINSIATKPKYQRKGYGSLCLKYGLLKECKENQIFYLEVYNELSSLHRLYENIGFKKEGITKSISFKV